MRTRAALIALCLAACQSPPPHAGHAEVAPAAVDEALRVRTLAEADWNRMQSVTMELRDYGMTPNLLRLKAGEPYKLTLMNSGGVSHYFTAPEFLQAVVARKAMVPNYAEIKAKFFTAFEVTRRGGMMEFYFVPLVKGSYRVHCHMEGKEHEGVEGTLIIE